MTLLSEAKVALRHHLLLFRHRVFFLLEVLLGGLLAMAECIAKQQRVPGSGLAEICREDVFSEEVAIESPANAKV